MSAIHPEGDRPLALCSGAPPAGTHSPCIPIVTAGQIQPLCHGWASTKRLPKLLAEAEALAYHWHHTPAPRLAPAYLRQLMCQNRMPSQRASHQPFVTPTGQRQAVTLAQHAMRALQTYISPTQFSRSGAGRDTNFSDAGIASSSPF
jgi:hypothetical protein